MGMNVLGYQTTIRDRISFQGVGVHSGEPVSMTLLPAPADSGIVFSLTCPKTGTTREIPAVVASVGATDLCTVLGDPAGLHAATVEHLMAALRALDVDNLVVEMESGEVPVMDGSSAPFVAAVEAVGLRSLSKPRCYLRVLKPVRVEMGTAWGELSPHNGTRFEIEIDFSSQTIGRQTFAGDLTAAVFSRELSRARTFGFLKDVERLWAAGFALGSSLDNSVVIGHDNAIINPEGLRYADEFVRHKALDAVGDLALAGAPILGCYRSYRGGHKLNSLVLKALLSDRSAFEFVGAAAVRPRVRHADLVAISAPAYAATLA
jgi:UDP-3-O-[3-hydroxymyristoyl] N-acetylglucosamine deacetylase